MLSCKEVTHLLSAAQDGKLTPYERLQLGTHLALCRGCRGFKDQMAFLRAACKRYVARQNGSGE